MFYVFRHILYQVLYGQIGYSKGEEPALRGEN